MSFHNVEWFLDFKNFSFFACLRFTKTSSSSAFQTCVLLVFSQVIGDSDLDDDAEVNDEVSDDAECWSSDLLKLDGRSDFSSFRRDCRTKLLTDGSGGKKLIFKWNAGVFNGCEKYLTDLDLLQNNNEATWYYYCLKSNFLDLLLFIYQPTIISCTCLLWEQHVKNFCLAPHPLFTSITVPQNKSSLICRHSNLEYKKTVFILSTKKS